MNNINTNNDADNDTSDTTTTNSSGNTGKGSIVKLSGECVQCGNYCEYRVCELWCPSCHNRLEDMGAI